MRVCGDGCHSLVFLRPRPGVGKTAFSTWFGLLCTEKEIFRSLKTELRKCLLESSV